MQPMIRKVHDAETEATKREVPAIGMSITAVIGDNRQVVFQTHFDSELSIKDQHAIVTRVLALADRQTDRYAVAPLEKEKRQMLAEIERYERDFATAEERFQHTIAAMEVEMQELVSKAGETEKNAYDAHGAAGKRGAFQLVGVAKAQHDSYLRGADKIREQIEKEKAERDTALQNLRLNREARIARVGQLDEELSALAEKIGGSG